MKKYTTQIPIVIFVDTYAEDAEEAEERSLDKVSERMNQTFGRGVWEPAEDEVETDEAEDDRPDRDWITEDEREVG